MAQPIGPDAMRAIRKLAYKDDPTKPIPRLVATIDDRDGEILRLKEELACVGKYQEEVKSS